VRLRWFPSRRGRELVEAAHKIHRRATGKLIGRVDRGHGRALTWIEDRRPDTGVDHRVPIAVRLDVGVGAAQAGHQKQSREAGAMKRSRSHRVTSVQISSRERCKKRAKMTPVPGAMSLSRRFSEIEADLQIRCRYANSRQRVSSYPSLVAVSSWVLILPKRSMASVVARPRPISSSDPPAWRVSGQRRSIGQSSGSISARRSWLNT